MDDCDTGTGSSSPELMREQGRRKKARKKNIQCVCQLAFPFEKVIHLTAPEMSRKNKGRLHCSMTCKFQEPFRVYAS